MINKTQTTTLAALMSAMLAVQAQTAAPAASAKAPESVPPLSSTEQLIKDIKNPVSWLNWGGDFRIRDEFFNNSTSLNEKDPLHEQNYLRFRARVWASIVPVKDLSINARLATESREYFDQSNSGLYNKGHTGLMFTYGILDNLNVQMRNIGDVLTVTAGRQDIQLGDGWLVMDGTPRDGSSTLYFDAARLTFNLPEEKTVVDVIGIDQNARANAVIGTINNGNFGLCDQNEKGAIVYASNKLIKQANLDAYFMYKHDDRLNNAPAIASGDDANIFTLGGRVSGAFMEDHLRYSAEGAYQFGEKSDPNLRDAQAANGAERHLNSFGVNSRLVYAAKDKLDNQVGLYYEYLTGDNPNTKTDEAFDVLWGRFPRWSEDLNIYGTPNEWRVGQIGNVHRFGPGWAITPLTNLTYSLNYYALWADQSTDTRASNPALFANGGFRGHFLQTVLKYKFNAHLQGHLWYEILFPGEFYASREPMTFVRAELLFTF